MPLDTMFFVALQSALVLGLIHGVNPCGHSWVVLAPFVVGDTSPRRVAALTLSFITGTTLGCLAIGLALGLLASGLPESTRVVADLATAVILIGLGGVLLWRPGLLHNHGHDHDDDHDHDHDRGRLDLRAATAWGLGVLGFVNMVVPCPTVAILYSYALRSADAARSVAVFGVYAVGTGLALAAVIFALHRITGLMRRLSKPWVEPMIMRVAGVLTVGFGVYSLVHGLEI